MDWKKIPLEQFRIGLGVEMEHADVTGGDPLKTGRIVLAHLKEDREYYSKLKRAGLEVEKGITFLQEGSSRGSLWTVDYFASAPGEQRGVWRVAVVQAMSKDEAIAKVRRKESTNAYSVLTQISVTQGHDVPGYEPGRILREGGAKEEKDSEEECHVCQPFTKLVRDEKEFASCMKLAEEIGELGSSKSLVKLIRGHMARQDQEIFVVVALDFRGQLRDFIEVNRGQRHRVAADVEDIVRPILLSGADGAVVSHCHPSGVAEPSDADRDLTIAIKKSMEIACPNIKFLDHLVVTPTESYSFADNGWSADGKVVKK